MPGGGGGHFGPSPVWLGLSKNLFPTGTFKLSNKNLNFVPTQTNFNKTMKIGRFLLTYQTQSSF